MKKTSENRISDARAGFTLLEIVVVIVVFGVLCAAAAVNWASFMRYQELREDAAAFHKELLALKAKALETGDSVIIKYKSDKSGYIVSYKPTQPVDPGADPLPSPREVSFNNKVEITAPTNTTANGDMPTLDAAGGGVVNNWKDSIKVVPNNLDAFEDGRVIIQNSSKKIFCVQKSGKSGIKPLMYYNGSGTWKKI